MCLLLWYFGKKYFIFCDYCRLTLGIQLGEGAFGQVFQADAVDIAANKGKTVVAVKMLKGTPPSLLYAIDANKCVLF